MIKLFYLIYILLYIYTIHCDILSKEDVLSYTIPSCRVDKDCPSDSEGCIYETCFFKFYCRGNECVSSSNTTYFYSNEASKDGKKGLIYQVCTQSAIDKEDCWTQKCISDTDCYSNYCVNNICMANEFLPIFRCNNKYENNSNYIKCSKSTYERCETDEECFSENCTKEKFCSKKINNFQYYKSRLLFILIVSLSLIILSIIIYCGIHCCEYRSRIIEEEIYNEEEEYREEEFEKEMLKKKIIDNKEEMNSTKIRKELDNNEKLIEINKKNEESGKNEDIIEIENLKKVNKEISN